MSLKNAKNLVAGMFFISVILSLYDLFILLDAWLAVTCIYSSSVMLYLYNNPELMLSTNIEEFDESYDKSKKKHLLWGSNILHLITLASFVYIYFAEKVT